MLQRLGDCMADNIEQLLDVAHQLADAARGAILPYFRDMDLTADNKLQGGFDPVTVADRAGEVAMREILARLRPNDTIVGEEFGTTQGSSGVSWVLDPIDGTRGFISGTPTWGVLIGVGDENGPFAGVIDQPYIGERFWGGTGRAFVDGPRGKAEIRTRGDRNLADAILFTTFPEVGSTAEGAAFAQVAEQAKLTRYGMDCYAYALLAAGQIDLVIEAGLSNYDIQGPMAVVQAAGGIVTDWQGGPAHQGGRVVAAASQQQHAAALEILSRV